MEIVPGFVAHGVTAGPIKSEDFRKMQALLLQTLRDVMPVDGVVLNMHGAMQSQDCLDCEGDTFAQVREVVGPDVPVTSSFDLHACVTPRMISLLDGMACFQTYPHTDHHITGYRAAEACVQLVREKLRPQKLRHSLPMIMAVENCSTEEDAIRYVYDGFAACVPAAERAGVRILLENHSQPGAWQYPDLNFHYERMLRLWDALKGLPIGINYDLANAYALGRWKELLELFGTRIETIHVNDLTSVRPLRFARVGTGVVPLDEQLRALSALGFCGPVCIEEAGMAGKEGVLQAVRSTQGLLNAAF